MKVPSIRRRVLWSASTAAALALAAPAIGATLTWNGAAGTSWNTAPSPWTLSGMNPDADTIPDSNDEVIIGNVGTVATSGGISSVMNLATPIIGRFSALDTGSGWHGLDLNGATLSVTGSPEATTGSFSVGLYTAGSATRAAVAFGNGSLVIGTAAENLTSTNRSFNVGFKSTTGAAQQTGVLDMSGLTSFAAHVGLVRIGVADNTGPATGQVTLAPTSLIRTTLATIGALTGGATPVGAQASSLTLGSVSNTLQIGTLAVGSSKSSGTLDVAGNNTGAVVLGGATAGSKVAVNVGVNAINSTSYGAVGDFDMAKAASFAANISTLTIGSKPTGTAGTGGAIGSFRTAAGVNAITIDSVTMANSSTNSVPAVALLTLQGSGAATIGTMIVANGNTQAGATSTTTGAVNQTGMSVTIAALTLTGSNLLGIGTYSLNGGELATSKINPGSGTSRFMWGNGTLKAVEDGENLNFMFGLSGVTITGAAVFDSNSEATTIRQVLAGSGAGSSLTKIGAGTLTLNAANTYAGGTTVSGGTLYLSNTTGSATGSGAVNVASGGTLETGSAGSVSGAVTVGGRVRVGSGTLSTGGLTFSGPAVLSTTLNTFSNRLGQIVVNGPLTLGTQTVLDLSIIKGAGIIEYINTFTLLQNNSANAADLSQYFVGLAPDENGFATFTNGQLVYTIQYNAAVNDAVGNDVVVSFQSVPEPAGLAAMALAGAGLLRRRRRQRLR